MSSLRTSLLVVRRVPATLVPAALVPAALVPAALVLGAAALGCGPSPAYAPPAHAAQPMTPVASATPVVVVVPADEDDDDGDADDAPASPPPKPVEYVRIDDWQPPPSVRDLESRVPPRGPSPPEYLSLPRLTKHREIANPTIRRGYWH